MPRHKAGHGRAGQQIGVRFIASAIRTHYTPAMDTEEKLRRLGGEAEYDVTSVSGAGTSPMREPGICKVAGPGGTALLRVLMTDACEHDCHFCPLRASAPRRRTSFEPDELSRLFERMRSIRKADGLYLSSATSGTADSTMERMLAAAELIRNRDEFTGYIHIKLLPGASDAVVEAAARLASRVSINVEVPSGSYLRVLGTGKDMARDILRPLRVLHRMEEAGNLPSGVSTQFVVGAAGESDREIVSSVRWLSEEFGVRRAYFGLFRPESGTPFEGAVATHRNRPVRLYQTDWLTRIYGLTQDEVGRAFDGQGYLPLGVDPKVSVALAIPENFPVEINRASYDELLRVPGIGPVAARRIVSLRVEHGFTEATQLKRAGVALPRAAPFIVLGGRRLPDSARRLARLVRQRSAPPEQFGVQLALPGLDSTDAPLDPSESGM